MSNSRLKRGMLIAGGALAGIGSTMSFGSAQALFPVDNGGAGLTDSLAPVASATPTAGQPSQIPNPTATSANPKSTTAAKPTATGNTKVTPGAKPSKTKKPSVKPTATATQQTGAVDGDYTGVLARAGVYGNVQVQIRVAGGVITAIAAPLVPSKDSESISINSWAVPNLKTAALSSQSANISSQSGASYTSRAFIKSLQSALTQAGL